MKKLQCEMCSSTDFIKEDGAFVCQSCGLKYSLEEAKKLMADDGVSNNTESNVPAPEKPAMSEEISNLFQLARRSKLSENEEDAQKYYEMLLIKMPNSWEAYFFSVYYKSWNCKVGQIATAALNVKNSIRETFTLINDYVTDAPERVAAVAEVCERAKKISDMLFQASINHSDTLGTDGFVAASISSATIQAQTCDCLCEIFGDDEAVMRGCGMLVLKNRISEGLGEEHVARYCAVIHKYDPSYVPPVKEEKKTTPPTSAPTTTSTTTNTTQTSSGGCYVATSVYGSYDCPQVWTLRRYRDYSLAETAGGRAFIKAYYAISPTLVKWFGETKWFKALWKKVLDKMVSDLQADGFEDTPYDDKQW